MAHPKVSYKRAKAISSSLFLISVAVLFFTDKWWPGLLLAIGIPLAIRHYLLGRTYDMWLTLTIFIGGFLAAGANINWDILIPVILVVAAVYMLIREFLDPNVTDESEDEESLNKEIEEMKDK